MLLTFPNILQDLGLDGPRRGRDMESPVGAR